MKKKDFFKKLRSKAGTGILFIAACFAAAFILFEFHDNYIFVGIAAVLLLLSAYLFLNALFEDKAKEWSTLDEEDCPGKSDGEFKIRVLKYIKDNETTQKEMLTTLNKQNEILTEQIENLEHEIYMLSEKQLTQTKTVIRFNKENARQVALNERDTVEKAVKEIKAAITGESYEETACVEESAVGDEIGFADESAVGDEISFAEDGAVGDEIGFADDGAIGDEIGFADESAVGDEIGFAEDGAVGDEIGFADESTTEDEGRNDEIFLGEESFEEPEAQQDIIAFELPEDFGVENAVAEEATEKTAGTDEEVTTSGAVEGLEIPDDITKMLENLEI